jgi:Ca2+/H+ antiporter, TMEM165/GDT1 family
VFSLTNGRAVVFGAVFLAELPDGTALAGLLLGTRFRASYVFAGVTAAFVVHVVLGVAAGSVLTLLPRRPLQAVAARDILGGRALPPRMPLRLIGTVAAVVMLALAGFSIYEVIRG